MSGSGAPGQVAPAAHGMTVVIIAARWHERVMDGLLSGALRAAREAGAEAEVVRAVGSFELPVLAAAAAERADAVVALGV
ncbi:MAG: 6,7-dimethyl-8-ribityllumazine synthase, partial [Actinomyces sp.]